MDRAIMDGATMDQVTMDQVTKDQVTMDQVTMEQTTTDPVTMEQTTTDQVIMVMLIIIRCASSYWRESKVIVGLVDDQGWGERDTHINTECLIMKALTPTITKATVKTTLDTGPHPSRGIPVSAGGEVVWEADEAHHEQLGLTPSLRARDLSRIRRLADENERLACGY